MFAHTDGALTTLEEENNLCRVLGWTPRWRTISREGMRRGIEGGREMIEMVGVERRLVRPLVWGPLTLTRVSCAGTTLEDDLSGFA